MRVFRRFFLVSSPEAAGLEVFFAALDPLSVVLAGALEAVEAGALPAVEAGLGAIADESGWRLKVTRRVVVGERGMDGGTSRREPGIYTNAP